MKFRNSTCRIRRMIRSHFSKMLIGWGFLALALLGAGCSRQAEPSSQSRGPGGAPPVPVTTGIVARENIPVMLQAIGNVNPISIVSIKAQVNGQLQKVHFRDGQDVHKGDLLFSIDPRPFEASLRQAESQLGRDQALLKQYQANLERDLVQAKLANTQSKRYTELKVQGVVAAETAEQYQMSSEALAASVSADQAAIENAQAQIRADQAAVDSARLQLDYCTIYSPINGRTGTVDVREGNLVKANDIPILVVIHQLEPIYVSFAVPEKYLAEIKQQMSRGKLPVRAVIPGMESSPAEGSLSFVDNKVDETTGTVQLKATFDNSQRALWPGQFVNVNLQLSTLDKATVVDSQVVQTGQSGAYVYVVKPDHTVEIRPITVQSTAGSKSVISRGLNPGEQVVVDGQLRLVSGSRIESKNAPSSQEKGR